MPIVTENDYKKFAEAAADDLVLHQIPLNDSIKKLASARSMNQEQVSRLCEATNNVVFNKLFQARDKTAEDRIIEFDVADPKSILGDSIKEASWDEPESDDTLVLSEFRSLGESALTSATKVAAEVISDVSEPLMRREVAQRTARKTHEYLRNEKLAAQMMYEDQLQSIKSSFQRLYAKETFPAWEIKVAAYFGPRAQQPLQDLRRVMKLPEVQYNFDVIQKTAGFIDDSGKAFELMTQAVAHHERIDLITRGIEKVEKML